MPYKWSKLNFSNPASAAALAIPIAAALFVSTPRSDASTYACEPALAAMIPRETGSLPVAMAAAESAILIPTSYTNFPIVESMSFDTASLFRFLDCVKRAEYGS